MYLTQTSFLGKTGPLDPSRVVKTDPLNNEKCYPNRWSEEKNLRTLHHRVTGQDFMNGKGMSRSVGRGNHFGDETLSTLNVNNQKYLAILYDFVERDQVWKALRWVNNISEENKKVSLIFSNLQGLRVIKAIIEVRGMKKFKASEGGSSIFNTFQNKLDEATSIANLDTDQARKFFRSK